MGKRWLPLTLMGLLVCCSLGFAQFFGRPVKPWARLGKGIVNDLAFSPDGKILAVASSVGIWLYDAVRFTELGLLEGQEEPALFIAFSPDGSLLASGQGDNTITLWDVEREETVTTLTLAGEDASIESIAFRPDGTLLASGNSVYDELTGEYVDSITLWDMVRQVPTDTLQDAGAPLAFRPDGQLLAATSVRFDEIVGMTTVAITLWDMARKEPIATLPVDQDSYDLQFLAFSPDGALLASGEWGGPIMLWDVERGEPLATLERAEEAVESVAFSPDGSLIASGGIRFGPADFVPVTTLWDVQREEAVATLDGGAPVAFSPDGKLLVTGRPAITFWNVERREAVSTLPGFAGSVFCGAFGPEGSLFASGSEDGTVTLWDVDRKEVLATWKKYSFPGVSSLVFSPDGLLLAAGGVRFDEATESFRNLIVLWDVVRKEEVATLTGKEMASPPPVALNFSPDGSLLAATDLNIITLWDVASKEIVGKLRCAVAPIAFSSDGSLLASVNPTGFANEIDLWDLQRREPIATLGRSQGDVVTSVAFSPDGSLLAVGNQGGTIELWNIERAEVVASLDETAGSVNFVAFSPDGGQLVSGSEENFTLWDVKSKEIMASLQQIGQPLAFTFSARGSLFASSLGDGSVYVWLVTPSTFPPAGVGPKGKRLTTLGMIKRSGLYPNYPNPFNPETWIPFQLAEPAEVSVEIYDVAGRPIRRLALGHLDAGRYLSRERAAYWDGRNERGEPVGSGVYLYTLHAGSYSETRRMVMIK